MNKVSAVSPLLKFDDILQKDKKNAPLISRNLSFKYRIL